MINWWIESAIWNVVHFSINLTFQLYSARYWDWRFVQISRRAREDIEMRLHAWPCDIAARVAICGEYRLWWFFARARYIAVVEVHESGSMRRSIYVNFSWTLRGIWSIHIRLQYIDSLTDIISNQPCSNNLDGIRILDVEVNYYWLMYLHVHDLTIVSWSTPIRLVLSSQWTWVRRSPPIIHLFEVPW